MEKKVISTTNPEISEREKSHYAVARKAAAEGMVLLKNNGILPLNCSRIALFGSGARKTVIGGTGSGSTNSRYSVSFEAGLLNAGIEITTKSWLDRFDNFYNLEYEKYKERTNKKLEGITDMMKMADAIMREPFVYPVGIEIKEKDILNSETDTAIYVIARQAGEAADRYNIESDYKLSALEFNNLKKLSENYKNLVVAVNVGGFIDLSFMDKIRIDAFIFCCQPGMEGGNAFVDIITGKENPSGKLASTWAKTYNEYPSAGNFSHYGDTNQQDYNEGIYVGYRYFDSFNIEPKFPFGFGLSYTNFSINVKDITYLKGIFTLDIKVKNIGSAAGKEVVQVYLTTPCGTNGTEYQRLTAYAKINLIESEKSQNIKISFDLSAGASYDEQRAAYILNPGQYIVRVGNSSRNTTPIAVFNIEKEKITEICNNACTPVSRVKEIVAPKRITENLNGVKIITIDTADVKTISHNYGELPLDYDKKIEKLIENMKTEDLAKLVIGDGFSGNKIVEILGAAGNTTSELFEKYSIQNIVLADGPAGISVSPEFIVTKEGQLKPLKISHPQLDFGMLGQMLRHGIGKKEDGEAYYQYATAFPVEMSLAQTWNTELLEKIGECVGREMTEFGITVWLAPAVNIHRNPLCGRTFEYYSEDPYISGTLASAIIKGVQAWEGKFVSIKHFACNNSEFDRFTSSSNINERALREIYLKGFEISVKESNPGTVMASYNKINGVYSTNNHDLLVKILRNEWGFNGLVMSDWGAVDTGRGESGLAIKSQNDLIMPGKPEQTAEIIAEIENGTISLNELKRCAARVLKLIYNK